MAKYKSLKDHVYEYIARKIKEGELLPNQKLNENAICTELEISRTPAREALIQLSSEELIEFIPRKGFFVKEFTDKRKEDMYTVLATLDALSAVLAMDNMTEEDFIHMEELIEQIDIAIKYKNMESFVKYHSDFHATYTSKCNNDTLIDEIYSLRNSFARQSFNDSGDRKHFDACMIFNKEHRIILDLFKEKKSEELEGFIKKTHWDINHPLKLSYCQDMMDL